jgi:DNA-binding SARP family transcriptional activator
MASPSFLTGSYVGDVGERLARLIRIYLAGRMAIEGTQLVDEGDLPGPMGRVLLAALALGRGPVSRARLASILWDGEAPDQFDRSLNPLLSKLRRGLTSAGGEGDLLVSGGGAVELRRTSRVWIDIEEARRALDAAEGALRRDRPREAWPRAAVATSVFRRPFLEGIDLTWVAEQRRSLNSQLLRAHAVTVDVWMRLGDLGQAAVAAAQLVEVDPFLETSHERLIRIHTMAGNRAAALLAFAECERVLRDQLGVEPSGLVQRAYEDALALQG